MIASKRYRVKGCKFYDSFTLTARGTATRFQVGDFALAKNDPEFSRQPFCYKILAVMEDGEADKSAERWVAFCHYYRNASDDSVPSHESNSQCEV